MSGRCEAGRFRIDRLTPGDAERFRAIRLKSLREAPTAFGSGYESEATLSGRAWSEKARQRTDPATSVLFISTDAGVDCGVVGGELDWEEPSRAWLLSMWVDPAERRRGVACGLIGAVVGWARGKGVRELYLHVTSINPGARRLYESMGFVMTGDTMPHPRFDELVEHEMRLDVIEGV